MNEDKVMRHKELCDGLNALYARKNHDYGDSFHQTFVEEGLAMSRIRLGDKFSRFKTLSRISPTDSTQQQVTDESIRDTLLDLANYAISAIKSASKAATINAATGLGHSVFNAIGNAGSAISASMDKSALYKNPATQNALLHGIFEDIYVIYSAHIDFINECKGAIERVDYYYWDMKLDFPTDVDEDLSAKTCGLLDLQEVETDHFIWSEVLEMKA